MTKLVLVRHAEALGNITRTFQGQTDSDVTPNGYEQLKRLEERMGEVSLDIIYTSDLIRAKKTALAVRGKRDIPIVTEPGLREINGGDWEDVPFSELPKRWSREYDEWRFNPVAYRMPNGESMRDVEERMLGAIERIVEGNRGKSIGIVSHGTALKIFMAVAKGWGLERLAEVMWFENTAVTMVDVDDDGKFDILIEGDVSHLPDELTTLKKQTWWKDEEGLPED